MAWLRANVRGHEPRVWPSKKYKISKKLNTFFFYIAKIAPCLKKINKSHSKNEKVATFGNKIPKLATLESTQRPKDGCRNKKMSRDWNPHIHKRNTVLVLWDF